MPRRRTVPIAYLTQRQVESVIGAAETMRDRAMFAVVYQCGLRRGEVRWLRRQDWMPNVSRYGALRIWRSKAGSGLLPDEKPVWKRTAKMLEAYLASRDDNMDALFLSKVGRPMGGQAVYEAFRKAAEGAGLPRHLRHPHVLRHSIATHQANMGATFSDIQHWLGHKNPASTMVYAQVLTPRKEDLILRSEGSHFFAKY